MSYGKFRLTLLFQVLMVVLPGQASQATDTLEHDQQMKLLQEKRWATYVMGATLIGATYAAIYWHLANNGGF